MAESSPTLELLQSQSHSQTPYQSQSLGSRRPRPPDLNMPHGDENRVPLRVEEKLRRRESRLGLRSIFSRQKSTTDLLSPPPARDTPTPSRSGGIRASLAEISNWPYGFHSARSEIVLPTIHQSSQPPPLVTAATAPAAAAPTVAMGPGPGPSPAPVKSNTPSLIPTKPKSHLNAPAPKSSRGALATWDPPPLFQAYPQAIRHVELPACTLSAEAILRMHGGKGSISLRDGLSLSSPNPDLGEAQDKASEKVKKKHRRNTSASSFKVDWTTKIYVLVTSGYLLQYSGEGSFDRLPEKILQLGKDSAAFASDLIPGKHWVVQVSAAMDSEGTATADNRSLFSRLPFRGAEKRQASLFLMVFESAEEMDHWLAILRREIEHLGGKKSLSETGRPKTDEDFQLSTQPSQRTLVVRDPDRFSRISTGSELQLPWERPEPARSRPDIRLDTAGSDSTPDQSFDDVSTTNSMVSHDGRQLDSLRERDFNRFSIISSGQRTITTPEGSSPACSPIRDSFSSYLDEPPFSQDPPFPPPPQLQPPPPPTSHPNFNNQEAQPRPNAQAILDRRMSMRTMNPLLDVRVTSTAPPRPLSTFQATATTPNFSVPHAVSRRYSLVKSQSLPLEPSALPSAPAPASVTATNVVAATPRSFTRRPPPPSLGFSRPLSIVADQPSPVSPHMHSTTSSPKSGGSWGHDRPQDSGVKAPDTPSIFEAWGQRASETTARAVKTSADASSRKSSAHVAARTSPQGPRRHASLQTLRPQRSDHFATENHASKWHQHPHQEHRQQDPPRFVLSSASTLRVERSREHLPRSKSSMGSYERERPRSPTRDTTKPVKTRRSSMFAQPTAAAEAFGSFQSGPGFSLHVPQHHQAPPSQPAAPTEAPTRPLPGLPPAHPPPPPTSKFQIPINHPHKPRNSVSTQHLRVASDSKALSNRRSMPHLTEGPPPAPPPTCALPPIPTRVAGPTRAARSQSIRV